jgi:AAA domain
MGIPGAGKTRIAEEYVSRGYVRLNRDERGGALKELAGALDAELSSGDRHVVLDNTYMTRAARSHVIDTAIGHGIAARCVWLDTPLATAQVNLVERMLDQFGALPAPDQLRALARRHPGVLAPTSQMRTIRELEPLLVPTAAPGTAARVRPRPRSRPVALDPARDRRRAPQPRGGARRALRRSRVGAPRRRRHTLRRRRQAPPATPIRQRIPRYVKMKALCRW